MIASLSKIQHRHGIQKVSLTRWRSDNKEVN